MTCFSFENGSLGGGWELGLLLRLSVRARTVRGCVKL